MLREGIECPSLSPDNRLIVFKRRIGSIAGSWRLYVLDLATMIERPVAAETQYIDDQVEWLDNQHVLYGVQRKNSGVTDVWISPVDDSGPSHEPVRTPSAGRGGMPPPTLSIRPRNRSRRRQRKKADETSRSITTRQVSCSSPTVWLPAPRWPRPGIS